VKDARLAGVRPNSRASQDVNRVLRMLERSDQLPLRGDVLALVPLEQGADPATSIAMLGHVRRVPGRNLWLWYREKAGAVELIALTCVPAGSRES
jgi:hypothetical protein